MSTQFDPSLDETIHEAIIEGDYNNEIHIGLYRYDHGGIKVGISRWYLDRNNKVCPKKLGRLTMSEAVEVAKILPEIIKLANKGE